MAHAPKTRSEKAVLSARRAWCYLVLVLISFLCLFFFYILIVNSTRTHFEIQKGFSLLPGKSMLTNFKNVLADANIPVGSGIRNSLIVSACSAALSVYFSLTKENDGLTKAQHNELKAAKKVAAKAAKGGK